MQEAGFHPTAAEQKWGWKPVILFVFAPPRAHERVIYGTNTQLNSAKLGRQWLHSVGERFFVVLH